MFTKVNNSGSKLEADTIKNISKIVEKKKNKEKEHFFFVFQECIRKRSAL